MSSPEAAPAAPRNTTRGLAPAAERVGAAVRRAKAKRPRKQTEPSARNARQVYVDGWAVVTYREADRENASKGYAMRALHSAQAPAEAEAGEAMQHYLEDRMYNDAPYAAAFAVAVTKPENAPDYVCGRDYHAVMRKRANEASVVFLFETEAVAQLSTRLDAETAGGEMLYIGTAVTPAVNSG